MDSFVKTKEELIARIIANRKQIQSYGVEKMGFFGSFVRNEANESSDVDFLVEFKPLHKNFDNFIELAFFLQRILGRKVEIVTSKSLSKYIGPYILKEVEYVSFAA